MILLSPFVMFNVLQNEHRELCVKFIWLLVFWICTPFYPYRCRLIKSKLLCTVLHKCRWFLSFYSVRVGYWDCMRLVEFLFMLSYDSCYSFEQLVYVNTSDFCSWSTNELSVIVLTDTSVYQQLTPFVNLNSSCVWISYYLFSSEG